MFIPQPHEHVHVPVRISVGEALVVSPARKLHFQASPVKSGPLHFGFEFGKDRMNSFVLRLDFLGHLISLNMLNYVFKWCYIM